MCCFYSRCEDDGGKTSCCFKVRQVTDCKKQGVKDANQQRKQHVNCSVTSTKLRWKPMSKFLFQCLLKNNSEERKPVPVLGAHHFMALFNETASCRQGPRRGCCCVSVGLTQQEPVCKTGCCRWIITWSWKSKRKKSSLNRKKKDSYVWKPDKKTKNFWNLGSLFWTCVPANHRSSSSDEGHIYIQTSSAPSRGPPN